MTRYPQYSTLFAMCSHSSVFCIQVPMITTMWLIYNNMMMVMMMMMVMHNGPQGVGSML